jgi:predicted MPP superfamily phosphohydrolase
MKDAKNYITFFALMEPYLVMLNRPVHVHQKILNRIGRHAYFNDERHSERRNEMRWLTVERTNIPIENLPVSLCGMTIVQLTDLHLHPFTRIEHIDRAVYLANSLKPDVIVLTGDYVWHDAQDILDLAPSLARLDAKYGVFSVLGNHEYKTDPVLIAETFEGIGIPVFKNQGVNIQVGKELLYLAGIDDGWLGTPDIVKTMSGHLAKSPVVLLAHEPDMIDWYAHDTRIHLQLSGHTHGGQIQTASNKPLVRPYLGRKYVQGLHRVNKSWVYTSRGIGTTGIPLRKNCSPEVTHITLVEA